MTKQTTSGGSLLTTLLLVAFIVLKLCKVIAWSWWWVLSPFWIPLTLAFLVLTIVAFARAYKSVYKEDSIPSKSKWQLRAEEMREQARKMKEKRERQN